MPDDSAATEVKVLKSALKKELQRRVDRDRDAGSPHLAFFDLATMDLEYGRTGGIRLGGIVADKLGLGFRRMLVVTATQRKTFALTQGQNEKDFFYDVHFEIPFGRFAVELLVDAGKDADIPLWRGTFVRPRTNAPVECLETSTKPKLIRYRPAAESDKTTRQSLEKTLWRLQHLVGARHPNPMLRQEVCKELRAAEKEGSMSPPSGHRVLLFYPEFDDQTYLCHAARLAAVFAGMGADATLLWQPMAHRTQPGGKETGYSVWQRTALRKLHDCFRMIDVPSLQPMTVSESTRKAVEQTSFLELQFMVGREVDEQKLSPEHEKILHELRTANGEFAARLQSLLQHEKFDSAVTFGGTEGATGIFFRMMQAEGIHCATMEMPEARQHLFIGNNRLVLDLDSSEIWSRHPKTLIPSVRGRVEAILKSRDATGSFAGSGFVFQSSPMEEKESLLQRLNLVSSRPVFLLCPNTICDAVTFGKCGFFRGIEDWVCQTLDFFAGHPDAQLVVRVHPGEKYAPHCRSVSDVVREHFGGNIPANIALVQGDAGVNTYGIMELCIAGIVFNSSTGMEIAARGKPVLVTADAHYRGKGFTTDPSTADEYFQTLRDWTENWRNLSQSAAKTELSWCYLDAYYNFFPDPYPWQHMTWREDADEWPVRRVLSKEGRERFGSTFRYMLTGKQERHSHDEF